METLKVTKEVEIKNAIKLSETRYLKIHHDSDGGRFMNDDDGQIATIVYKGGSRYNLGDKPNRFDGDCNNHEDAMYAYFKGEYGYSPSQVEKNVLWLPVYAYVHGSATISTDSSIATCPWDSGRSGFVYTTKEKIRNVRGCKNVTEKIKAWELAFLRGHVEHFNDLLQGKVYGFKVVDENDEHVDSCWGFVGDLNGDNGLNMADHISVEGLSSEQIHEKIKEIADNDLIIYRF